MNETIERIIGAYHYALTRKPHVDDVYEPGVLWTSMLELRRDFITALEDGNADKLDSMLSNMFRNETTMFLLKYGKPTPDSKDEWEKKMSDNIIDDLYSWARAVDNTNMDNLDSPIVGNPYGIWVGKGAMNPGSAFDATISGDIVLTPASVPGNYYAQKIKHLLKLCGGNAVGEIGTGIGFLPYYLSRMTTGVRYVNFDLPEVLAVSQYFLMTALPDHTFMLGGEEVQDWDMALLPNFDIQEWTMPVDVFVNIHSMSEMERDTIGVYVDNIARLSNRYFYQENAIRDFELSNGMKEVGVNNFPGLNEKFIKIYNHPGIWREPIYGEYLYEVRHEKLRNQS